MDDAEWQRYLLGLGSTKDARPIPAFGEKGEHPVDRLGHAETFGEHPGNLAEGVEVPVHEAVGGGEPGGDLISLGWPGRPRVGQCPDDTSEIVPHRPVLAMLVVLGQTPSEDRGLVLCVDRAPRVGQEIDVIGACRRLCIDSENVTQSHCRQRGLKTVFERKTHPQVGRQTQRGDHLGGSHLLPMGFPHPVTVTVALSGDSGSSRYET